MSNLTMSCTASSGVMEMPSLPSVFRMTWGEMPCLGRPNSWNPARNWSSGRRQWAIIFSRIIASMSSSFQRNLSMDLGKFGSSGMM